MGRKQFRAGQYFYICFAGVAFLLFFGCAAFEEIKNRQNANEHLLQGRTLLEEGDFRGALLENQKVHALFIQGPPGDEALFNIGLIYSHYGNPENDYKKASHYFEKIVKDYPRSPLVEEAKIWLGVLKEIEKAEIKIEKVEIREHESAANDQHLNRIRQLFNQGDFEGSLDEIKKLMPLSSNSPFGDEVLFYYGLIYAHYGNPERDYNKSLDYFAKLIEEYPESPLVEEAKIWMDVLNVIEKAKQVDIEIEKKKKELTR